MFDILFDLNCAFDHYHQMKISKIRTYSIEFNPIMLVYGINSSSPKEVWSPFVNNQTKKETVILRTQRTQRQRLWKTDGCAAVEATSLTLPHQFTLWFIPLMIYFTRDLFNLYDLLNLWFTELMIYLSYDSLNLRFT